MEADELEREILRPDGAVRFRDRQRTPHLLPRICVVPLLCVAMAILGVDTSTVLLMAVVGLIGGALELALSSYRIVVTERSLHVQLGLRVDRVPLAAIRSVEVAPHRWTEAMVGRGVFKQSRDGRVRSYRVAGRSETVRVTWDRGDGPRTTIIATDRAEALVLALRDRRPSAARPRVALDDLASASHDQSPAARRAAARHGRSSSSRKLRSEPVTKKPA